MITTTRHCRPFARSLVVVAAIVAVHPAFGDIAYNNLGTDDAFNHNDGWNVGYYTGGHWSHGFLFTSATTGMLDRILIGLSRSSGTNAMHVDLYAARDAGGGDLRLGTQLKGWDVVDLPQFGDPNMTPTLLTNNDSGVTLSAGGAYYLVAEPGAPDFFGFFNTNSTGAAGKYVYWDQPLNGGQGDWNYQYGGTTGAFRVETAVPEPATILVLALGGAGVCRRRRSKGLCAH
ncbi:MAG: PEP-CTERM sorting domain-containing protein [Fimbriimonadaceae bacterium]|nr:PEP-CTERM sorting domain-containing protein [Chthonomonadaceae bacterium]MCO5295557.1 PEP-CTERM sorting domain-containing protein [Fimbriimonadaceae bacterium]